MGLIGELKKASLHILPVEGAVDSNSGRCLNAKSTFGRFTFLFNQEDKMRWWDEIENLFFKGNLDKIDRWLYGKEKVTQPLQPRLFFLPNI